MGFYDRCIKRVSGRCPRLVVFATNSIFGKRHSLDAEVVFLDKEQVSDTKESLTYMDMRFSIEECEYHWEFQLEEDNMAIRMYEYGIKETLRQTGQMDKEKICYELNVVMPQQAVIFLSGTKTEYIKVNMTLPDGNVISYNLKCVDASDSIESLVERKLYMLLPFQLLKMNNKMKNINRVKDKTKIKMAKNIFECSQMLKSILEKLVGDGILTLTEAKVLQEIYLDIEEYFLEKNEKVRLEVESMGENDYISLSERVELGRQEGLIKGRTEGEVRKTVDIVCKKLEKNIPEDQIAEMLEENIEVINKICAIATKYAPDYDIKAICEEYWKENK